MSKYWKTDLSWSKAAFIQKVWPELSEFLGGKIRIVEGSTEEMDKTLDQLAGIDVWHIQDEGQGISGIASRVQECPPPMSPYNTFTIRKSRITGTRTEYQKLTEAIAAGRLYPSLFVQAYITNKHDGELVSFGVAQTKKIIEYINEGKARINATHNADFFIVPFRSVATFIYPKSKITPTKTPHTRRSLINKIAQCHLQPGWNVARQNALFDKYRIIKTKDADEWAGITDEQLYQMAIESEITKELAK